jgi:hypothetical protein
MPEDYFSIAFRRSFKKKNSQESFWERVCNEFIYWKTYRLPFCPNPVNRKEIKLKSSGAVYKLSF